MKNYLHFVVIISLVCTSPFAFARGKHRHHKKKHHAAHHAGKKHHSAGGGGALWCLASTIQGEAGGAGPQQMALVAQTVMARAGGAGRVCAVTNARSYEANRRRKKPTAAALAVARRYINNKSGGWTHFINPKLQRKKKRAMPSWYYAFRRGGCQMQTVGSGMQQQIYINANRCSRAPGGRMAEAQPGPVQMAKAQEAVPEILGTNVEI